MPVICEHEHNYGADADGRRGIDVTWVEYYSDISNEGLEEDEIYLTPDNQMCSKEELIQSLEVTKKVATKRINCEECDEVIHKGEVYYEFSGMKYCEECFNTVIEEEYHISGEDACELQEERDGTARAEYLADW